MQTLRVNNSRTLTIKNVKFSRYYLHMNSNIWGDFQICISVPLKIHKEIPVLKSLPDTIKELQAVRLATLLKRHPRSGQKQPPEVFCKKRCSQKFRKIHRKAPVPESLF